MHWTPNESKLIKALSDGMPHPYDELIRECFDGDSQATRNNLNALVVQTRRKLRPRCQDIICELRHRKVHYRHVQLLYSSAE